MRLQIPVEFGLLKWCEILLLIPPMARFSLWNTAKACLKHNSQVEDVRLVGEVADNGVVDPLLEGRLYVYLRFLLKTNVQKITLLVYITNRDNNLPAFARSTR